jgi:membrane fusion protein (multidrug efflux system)
MSSMASSEALDRSPPDKMAPAAVAEPKKSKAKPYLILAAVLGLAAAVYGVFAVVSRGKENTDDAQVEADVVAVSTRVSGAVLKVYVTDNQQVTKDQPLVDIDPADYGAKVKQAEAELAQHVAAAQAADAQVSIVEATARGSLSVARAQLSGSATSVSSASADVAAAQAAVTSAQARADQTDVDLARDESLLKDQAIPRAQVDAARSASQEAHAAVAQMQAQLSAAKDRRSKAQTGIAESAAKVEESRPVDAQLASARARADQEHALATGAQASLDLARLQLSYTHIVAPASGVLSRLGVREGQLVQVGQQVVTVVPTATYVLANFKETQVGKMRAGQRVEISVDAYPGRTFEGKIDSTSPGTGARFSMLPPDNASGNFVKVVQRLPVKIAWVDVPADTKLAAGMSADVTVFTR